MRIHLFLGIALAGALLAAGNGLALIEAAEIATGAAQDSINTAAEYAQQAPGSGDAEDAVWTAQLVASNFVSGAYQIVRIEDAAIYGASDGVDIFANQALHHKGLAWDCGIVAVDGMLLDASYPPYEPVPYATAGSACLVNVAIAGALQEQAAVVFFLNGVVEA
jgi:hypothetical protein